MATSLQLHDSIDLTGDSDDERGEGEVNGQDEGGDRDAVPRLSPAAALGPRVDGEVSRGDIDVEMEVGAGANAEAEAEVVRGATASPTVSKSPNVSTSQTGLAHSNSQPSMGANGTSDTPFVVDDDADDNGTAGPSSANIPPHFQYGGPVPNFSPGAGMIASPASVHVNGHGAGAGSGYGFGGVNGNAMAGPSRVHPPPQHPYAAHQQFHSMVTPPNFIFPFGLGTGGAGTNAGMSAQNAIDITNARIPSPPPENRREPICMGSLSSYVIMHYPSPLAQTGALLPTNVKDRMDVLQWRGREWLKVKLKVGTKRGLYVWERG